MKNKKNDNAPEDFPAYPVYPASEDIYTKSEKVSNINPDDNTLITTENENGKSWNEKAPSSVLTGEDLDIPDIELIEKDEDIGEEDEENSYYSLGGDAHNNLEEFNTDII